MTSYYTLFGDQISLAQSPGSSFEIYIGFHDPVGFTQASQDITTNDGTVVLPPADDRLAEQRAPFVPSPVFGSNRIGFVGEPLYFDGSRSTQRSGMLAWGHTWTATGPNTLTTYSNTLLFNARIPGQSSMGNQQCSIIWTAPGNYYVTLTVTDRYGNSFTGTRQVRIYASRTAALPGVIQITSLTGSVSQGGWTCDITTVAGSPGFINPNSLPVGFYLPVTLIVEEQHFQSITSTINRTIGQYGDWVQGQPYNDPRILIAGYVAKGSFHQDDQYDTLTFTIQTPDMIVQEANILTVGFYNASWEGQDTEGRWNQQLEVTTSSDQLIADMTSEDVYRALLIDHVTFADYHDLIVWNRMLIDPVLQDNVTALTYTGLTANQGTLWSALQTVVQNEFANIWCERDGSLRIGPTLNYKGAESWGWYHNAPVLEPSGGIDIYGLPTVGIWPPAMQPLVQPGTSFNTAYPPMMTIPIGAIPVSSIPPPYAGPHIVYVDLWKVYNLRYEFFSDIVGSDNPYGLIDNAPATPTWAPFVNVLWGHAAVPQPRDIPTTPPRDPSKSLVFPVVCHFSDVSEWNGNQDLSITPYMIDGDEKYAARSSFIKLIAYLLQQDQAWSAVYPLGVFDATGEMVYRLPVGDFALQDNLLLPDMTNDTAVQIGWAYLWNMARSCYFAQNARYSPTVTYGLSNFLNLEDIVFISRQKPTKGPSWNQKIFAVNQISYAIDLNQRTWVTAVVFDEVTSTDPSLRVPLDPPWPPPSC